MSKKARRERTPNLPPEAFNVPQASAAPVASEAATPATTSRKAATTSAASSQAVDWHGEYGEVLGDLRRTFLIFTGLVVAMIVLSFVIR
jgi:hypothetical protein